MTATDIAAIIGALSLVLTALGQIYSIHVQRGTRSAVEEVHVATNSMHDQIVASTQLAAEAKGRDDERANPTGRTNE